MSPARRGDQWFMRAALVEAARGLGRTSPNPAVGAVLVKAGRIIARGHHARAGAAHAEVVALRAAGPRARGAVLYTTLEPCDHHGRTPPCSQAILAAGVARVVVGAADPNPLVNGRGVARLRREGVPVETGVLAEACAALNAPWLHYMSAGRPYVTLKLAATLDGQIATRGGDSRWVSGPESRQAVHRLRDLVDAVLVGAGTARADDPRLTTRLPGRRGRDPLRVVLDSQLRLPRSLRLFRQRSPARTVVAHATARTRDLGPRVDLLRCRRARGGGVDLADLLARLAGRGVVHLLVEGGAAVAGAFLAAGLVDQVVLFLAPRILGQGLGWSPPRTPRRVAEALRLEHMRVVPCGDDLLVTGTPALARPGRRV